jgi:hypothetical protein
MMNKTRMVTLFTLFSIFLLGAEPIQEEDSFLQEAREVVKQFAADLRSHLQQAMKSGGPEASIGVCSEMAPAIASRLSRERGWMIRRVSLKVRNPLDIPDAWEQETLKKFEADLHARAEAGKLEHSEMVMEGDKHYFRYMKAIPTGDLCLICHGTGETLLPKIQEILKENYPHDKATGYRKGIIRGAFSIKRPL